MSHCSLATLGAGEGQSLIFLPPLSTRRDLGVTWDPGCGAATVTRNNRLHSWISKSSNPMRQVSPLSIAQLKKITSLKSPAS